MKKYLALMLCVCMIFSTFAMMNVSAATQNKDIAPLSVVEFATAGYGENIADNMFDGKLDTYYMAGKVTDADGAEVNTSSSNTVWIKLADHEKITKIEATFGSKADRTALFGNGGNQNQNFYLYLTDFGPDEATFDGTNGIVVPEGKTATRITNGHSDMSGYSSLKENVTEEAEYTYLALWGPFSAGLCLSELKVYGMVEVAISGDLVEVNKNIATEKYGAKANFRSWSYTPSYFYSNAGYEASNVLDSNPETIGFGALPYGDMVNHYTGNLLLIDLGEEREITKLKLKWPSSAQITAAKEAIGSLKTGPMNQSGNIFLTNTIPVSSELSDVNYSGSGVSLYSGNAPTAQTTLTNADGNSYRYVGIWVPYSCGVAVSDVEVYANIMEEAAPPVSVNVAKDKMVYSTANNAEALGEPKHFTYEMNAVDGKAGTVFAGGVYHIDDDIVEATGEMKDTTCNFETIVDLGEKYLITNVKFNPYGDEKTSIYGSNSNKLDDLEVIAENIATTDGTVQEYTEINKEYRYIVVDRIGSEVNQILGIRDIEVYTDLDEDSIAAATKDNRGVKVNLNKNVLNTGDIRWETNPESLVDGKYDYADSITQTFILSYTSGQRNYVVVDLGAAYEISAVGMTQPYDCSGFANTGWEVVATNDAVTAETLADASWVTLASNQAYANLTSMYTLPIDINSTTAYRYVGIIGCSGMGMPFRELDIYASAAGYDFGTYTAYASGNDVAVEFTSDDAAGSDSAEILIASYDANGALINIVSETFEIDWTNGGAGSDLYEDAIAEGAETVKVFIIDPASTMSPLANCITL